MSSASNAILACRPIRTAASTIATIRTGERGGGDTAVVYRPAGVASARVEVSVFEWATDAGRLGPF